MSSARRIWTARRIDRLNRHFRNIDVVLAEVGLDASNEGQMDVRATAVKARAALKFAWEAYATSVNDANNPPPK